MYNMYSVNSEIVKEWNTITPAKPKESTRKNNYHRKQIDHEVDEQIAWLVAWQLYKHFTRMCAK